MVIRFQKRLFLFILSGVLILGITGCTPENLGQTENAIVYLQILNPNGQIYDIVMYNEDLEETKTVEEKTDRDGFLMIPDVIPGNYIIYASDQIVLGGWYGVEFYEIYSGENYIEITVREHTPY